MAQPRYEWRPPEQGWTEKDLLSLPADGHRYEIVDGSLHVTPPADFKHHELADEIRAALRSQLPPRWRVIREIGVRVPGGNAIPDLTVLRPTAPGDAMWAEPADVLLVVEVESPSSRRHDRFTKLSLYAEAEIDWYWRIERAKSGAVAHLYQLAEAGHYELRHSVPAGSAETVELPFPVRVAPTDWSA
ncbi:Uma2 family endonuclease [Plantactinospora sonchi]|uniref:Uma2 family endonuclease n=1 Tax=Plantactinospora sonchi TaxID=1544735 RepID=A0ABU7S1X2_9ACTN